MLNFSIPKLEFIDTTNLVALRKLPKTSRVPRSPLESFSRIFSKNLRWARSTPFSSSVPHFSVESSFTSPKKKSYTLFSWNWIPLRGAFFR